MTNPIFPFIANNCYLITFPPSGRGSAGSGNYSAQGTVDPGQQGDSAEGMHEGYQQERQINAAVAYDRPYKRHGIADQEHAGDGHEQAGNIVDAHLDLRGPEEPPGDGEKYDSADGQRLQGHQQIDGTAAIPGQGFHKAIEQGGRQHMKKAV